MTSHEWRPVATIGSPNSTVEFRADILETSITSPLEGRLFCFWHDEGESRKLVLAQLTTITGRNRWHEDPVLKAVIRRQGRLEHLSGTTDTKEAKLVLVGAFEESDGGNGHFRRTVLNTPPASGTPVYELTPDLLTRLVADETGIFYLGYFYGSDTPAPFYLKHYGPEPEGVGEALHTGVFGKTGMGKSILAAQMIIGFARHHDMGILIVDPQGEFYDNRFAAESGYNFDFHGLLRRARGNFGLVDLSEVALTGRRTFARLLMRMDFFKVLGFGTSEKERQAADALLDYMQSRRLRPDQADLEQIVGHLAEAAGYIYAGTQTSRRQEEVRNRFQQYQNRVRTIWDAVYGLFAQENRTPLNEVIDRVLLRREIVVLDVDRLTRQLAQTARIGNYELKYILLNEIFTRMLQQVQVRFREGEGSNCLVVLDEAHRYVPQRARDNEDLEALQRRLVDAAQTTRKYGIGWMFITTSIADFHNDTYRSLHNYVFAWGLGIGIDERHVREVVGDEMFNVYRTLPNPKQSGIYTFMVSGPIVAAGTRGMPVIIRGFENTDIITRVNNLNGGN